MALLAKLRDVLVSAGLETGLERAIQEFQQIFAVPGEIQSLTTKVMLIKAVLKDAEEKQINSEAVRLWLRELKEVLLDAEDVVDEYTTDEARRWTGAEARKKVHIDNSGLFTSNTMTACHQINEINERIDDLARRKDMFGLQFLLPSTGNSDLGVTARRQTSSILADVTSVIGRDSEKQEIMQLLLSSNHGPESSNSSSSSFSVLPVVGMGGLGKTTLARLVFNDERVEKHFELRMWLCVSIDFDPTRLTKEMIDDAAAGSWESMQQQLRRKVEGKTFLLVLDDVWEASRTQWERLLAPLNFAKKGSKILVTTRNKKAVDTIVWGRMMGPVFLGSLSDDDLWLLFKRCAFYGYNPEEYPHLEGMGRQMANRLKGVPLAAKTIGYLLNTGLNVRHWREIEKSEMWRLQQDEDDILPVLGLSYQYLPENPKRCFAYCSLFPKDHNFDKAELAQLWDAQCFNGIRTNVSVGTEDISSEYFDNLQQRSFFEPSQWGSHYVMHDLTHDLAEYVSKDDCFRLEVQRPMNVSSDTVRHMSLLVTKFDQTRLNELCRHEKLRTLLFLRSCVFDDLTHALDELFSKLKRLRVLGLRECGIVNLPSSIGDLKHLRYIDLSENGHLENLPESLCNLYNLQTLKLEFCPSLRALPIGMSKLINLRRLCFCPSLRPLPTGMSKLINLRHLCLPIFDACGLFSRIAGLWCLTCLRDLEVSGRKVGELGRMGMLRELRIRNLEEVMSREVASQARLGSKEHLQMLRLEWEVETNREVEEEVLQALRPVHSLEQFGIHGYKGAKSPTWMEDPTAWRSFSLQVVELRDCPNWVVLPAFGQLRLLRILYISNMPSVRRLDLRFFPSLEELCIEDLPEWEEWESGHPDPPPQQNHSSSSSSATSPSSSIFTRLRQLRISGCPKLRELPPLPPTLRGLFLKAGECSNLMMSVPGLLGHHLTALESLQIYDCEEPLSLPEGGFGHLVSLETLEIRGCSKLTCPPIAEGAPSQHLPLSLKKFEIADCGDGMAGWWWAGLQHLTSLAELSLRGCPTTADSLFVSLTRHHRHHLAETLTGMKIERCGYDYRQQSTPPPPLPSNPLQDATAEEFRPLTSLRRLNMSKSPNLLRKWAGAGLLSSLRCLFIQDDDDLDDGCLQYLTSLERLSISGCPAITSLPALPSVKVLSIRSCPKLNSLLQNPSSSSSSSSSSSIEELYIWNSSPQQINGWLLQSNLALPLLRRLDIIDFPQLTSFGEDGGGKKLEEALLHLAPSLRGLTFKLCENLSSLPAQLSSLSSLETLDISSCPKIQSLPEMGLPASLKSLYITFCPTLEERCRDQGGPERCMISRVPNVYICWERIL